jgi:glycosyltransferase involved in cell wall biosynthesis
LGITALSKTLTLPPLAFDSALELPPEFSVLTYIPDFRYRFYAGDCLYEAARRLPEIRFNVVGGLGTWVTEPLPNLVFHGWQSDMHRFHRDATVLVRLVEHDGTGLTAIEGLSLGRHVIYSHPLPHTIPVAWGDSDALVDTLRGLLALHQRGSLPLNVAGRAYIEEHFSYAQCMEDLMSYFLEIAAGRQDRKEERYEH